jgi:hypothetical protein
MLIPLVVASERGLCQKLKYALLLDKEISSEFLIESCSPVWGISTLRVVGAYVRILLFWKGSKKQIYSKIVWKDKQ